MDFNIEIRRKQLENLDQFMSSSRDRVDSILEYLGWSAQKITENQKEMVKCMVNPSSHRIPAASAVTHVQNCAWRKENYAADDLPLSEPNPVPGSTIVIDDMTKINVLNGALAKNPLMKTGWRSHEPVPKTSNRLLATFTPDERLALYDYTVAATRGPPEVPEFNVTKPKIEERHNLTPDELKAIHRDARRRRIKYKSKCVHTNRKSTTEVLRDVIESQMEQYEDYLRDEQDGGSIAGLTECSDRSISKERRDDREVSKERRADYDDRSYSKEKRDYDREKRDDHSDKSYSKKEDYDDKNYSKRNDDYKRDSYKHYSKDKKEEYDDKSYNKRENYNDKSKKVDDYDNRNYSKKEDDNDGRNYSKDRKDMDSSSYSKDEYNGRADTTYSNVEPNVNKELNQDNNIKEQHTMKVHTKGYLKEYSTELRNNYSQEQNHKDTVNNKKHQLLIEAELEHESNETASPRSSRSQNSYRSQESRHRGRPRTPTEPEGRSHRERSRSRDRRYSSRYENEHRHDRSRRYDRDHERKYRDRRHRYDRHRSDR